MKVLDLFCGAGGAGMGIHQAFPNAKILGIDIKESPNYPFDFVKADANEFPTKGFDFIWASPPCQRYSVLSHLASKSHKALVPEVRKRLIESGVPYAMENVVGAPFKNPVTLCGSHFGLKTKDGHQLRRHRIFETSFPITCTLSCNHTSPTIGIFGSKARDTAQEKRHYSKPKATRGNPHGINISLKEAQAAMGINWMGFKELSQAIPPAYSKWIVERMFKN